MEASHPTVFATHAGMGAHWVAGIVEDSVAESIAGLIGDLIADLTAGWSASLRVQP